MCTYRHMFDTYLVFPYFSCDRVYIYIYTCVHWSIHLTNQWVQTDSSTFSPTPQGLSSLLPACPYLKLNNKERLLISNEEKSGSVTLYIYSFAQSCNIQKVIWELSLIPLQKAILLNWHLGIWPKYCAQLTQITSFSPPSLWLYYLLKMQVGFHWLCLYSIYMVSCFKGVGRFSTAHL